MSTIIATTIKATAVQTSSAGPVTLTKQYALRMWVNSSGSASINDSFNVASGTDLGTGNYQYNFTNNQSNTYDYYVFIGLINNYTHLYF